MFFKFTYPRLIGLLCFGLFLGFCHAAQGITINLPELDENWVQPEPAVLPPQRAPQLSREDLEASILRIIEKDEAAARREAEEQSREEASRRQHNNALLIQREQQSARESAQSERELKAARLKQVNDALKSAGLPPAAVLPPKSEWPMPTLIEDPEWNNSIISLIGQSFEIKEDFAPLYRICLLEAIEGNPLGMLYLSEGYRRWGTEISGPFRVLYLPMHNASFWRRWAEEMTSRTWVALRLGDLAENKESQKEFYTQAAAMGNAEAMFKLSRLEERPDLLVQAAIGGHARASALTAFSLLMGTDGFPANQRLAGSFWWRAALGGDAQALLLCSEYFFRGLYDFPKDARRACIFALLTQDAARLEDAEKIQNGDANLLTQVAEKQLENLILAARFDENTVWQLSQEKEIFKSARQEETMSRLGRLQLERARVLADLQDELFSVDMVIRSLGSDTTEELVLLTLDKAMAGLEEESTGEAIRNEARERNNFNFVVLCLSGALLLPLLFLLLRGGVIRRIAKFLAR